MDNLPELEKELKIQTEILEKSLKENHANIEATFYASRQSAIQNLKSYLTNISLISATIIPFSSLVFQIPEKFLKININLWVTSLLCLIISLGIFIFCFLKLIETEKHSYITLLLNFIGSSQINFISLTNKEASAKTLDLMDIFKSQEKFYRDLKDSFKEKDFVDFIQYVNFASILFIFALAVFFLSIIYSKLSQITLYLYFLTLVVLSIFFFRRFYMTLIDKLQHFFSYSSPPNQN